ncbi:MAG: GAF domain-containing protein [Myxococcales bacterium]|nr:GAF domain-containing protein [Myxococcales bacterium]
MANASLTTIAAVLAELEGLASGDWRLRLATGGPASAVLTRGRAKIAIVGPGGSAAPDVDIAVAFASPSELRPLVNRIAVERVLSHELPIDGERLRRIVGEALQLAVAVGQARLTDQLLDIGLALNHERDPQRVLAMLLSHARTMTGADAGSIYVVTDDGRALRFHTAQNDSIHATLLGETLLPVSESSIVGACVLSGEIINLADLYSEAGRTALGRTFVHDRSFDERSGYQTRSMLTVPMRSPDGAILGAFQLINAKRTPLPLRRPGDFERQVKPFSSDDERLCASLAAQGAVALENARLYAEIQGLFEGFVRASVKAIEQRDPTTSGHSQRVASLTVRFAEVIDGLGQGPYADHRFSREELRELEYAGLLHDFGKVGVREQVLVKAKKLHGHQLELILGRLDRIGLLARIEMLEAMVADARCGRLDEAREGALKAAYAATMAELARSRDVVLTANEPSLLPEEVSHRVREVGERTFLDRSGARVRLLDDDEVGALLIARGSLTQAERLEVQSHVSHTYDFLRQIPWGRSLARIPEIAGKHHEYLNGTGYPSRLSAEAIPIQARMMTITDIFDALTASDRPYKKAVPMGRAFDILAAEARAGKIEPGLLEIFIEAGVFKVIGGLG